MTTCRSTAPCLCAVKKTVNRTSDSIREPVPAAYFRGPDKVTGRGAPMAAALAVILGSLVLLAVLLVIAIATWTGYQNTVDLLRQKAEIMVSAALDQMHIHLEAAELQAGYVSTAIASGEIDPKELDSFVALLSGALAATPQITSIGFVDRELVLTAVERDEPTSVPIFAKLADDITWQKSLDKAQNTTDGYWAGLVWRHEYESAQLTRRQPVYHDAQFIGYVIVEVGIASLSELIGNLETDFGLNAFILLDRQQVVAHPTLQFGFPGLRPGDQWCLCAARFLQAHDEGCAPQVRLEATHERALDIVPLHILQLHAPS